MPFIFSFDPCPSHRVYTYTQKHAYLYSSFIPHSIFTSSFLQYSKPLSIIVYYFSSEPADMCQHSSHRSRNVGSIHASINSLCHGGYTMANHPLIPVPPPTTSPPVAPHHPFKSPSNPVPMTIPAWYGANPPAPPPGSASPSSNPSPNLPPPLYNTC